MTVTPPRAFPSNAGAISGQRQQIAWLYTVEPDCSNGGSPQVTVNRPPAQGKLDVAEASGYPNFPHSNVRSECNKKKVAGIQVFYTSNPGYHGTDQTSLSVVYQNGQLQLYDYNIVVE